jgi:hypothetical protein
MISDSKVLLVCFFCACDVTIDFVDRFVGVLGVNDRLSCLPAGERPPTVHAVGGGEDEGVINALFPSRFGTNWGLFHGGPHAVTRYGNNWPSECVCMCVCCVSVVVWRLWETVGGMRLRGRQRKRKCDGDGVRGSNSRTFSGLDFERHRKFLRGTGVFERRPLKFGLAVFEGDRELTGSSTNTS